MHDVLVSVHIMTEQTKAKGIRLPESLWRAIDEAAANLNLKPHEWIRRRLEAGVVLTRDVQNPQANSRDTGREPSLAGVGHLIQDIDE